MMNELYSNNASDKYDNNAENGIEDGFDNECDGVGRYLDYPIMVDYCVKDGIHHNDNHSGDDNNVDGDEYGDSSDDYETASHE
eukprot:4482879-Ditylum_brightwellii.AAC.1